MQKYKFEYSNEKIVLHYVESGDHSAWFDDGSTSIPLGIIYTKNVDIPKNSQRLRDASVEELKLVLEYLAERNSLVCRCGRVFDKSNAVSTGFAGVKCSKCAEDDEYCPETENNTHNMKYIRGKNNTRIPTVRRCSECGYEDKIPPTG